MTTVRELKNDDEKNQIINHPQTGNYTPENIKDITFKTINEARK